MGSLSFCLLTARAFQRRNLFSLLCFSSSSLSHVCMFGIMVCHFLGFFFTLKFGLPVQEGVCHLAPWKTVCIEPFLFFFYPTLFPPLIFLWCHFLLFLFIYGFIYDLLARCRECLILTLPDVLGCVMLEVRQDC